MTPQRATGGAPALHAGLAAYVQAEILPRYAAFGPAHGPAHVARVVQGSLAIAAGYPVDVNMVYVIAAYHDLGLAQGRNGHEKASAAQLLADTALPQWFVPAQLAVMAEAVEDHRASAGRAPRSLYGRIVADADRDLDYATLLERTVQYGLEHAPTLDLEGHYRRTVAHLEEKYGEHGYMTLWLDTEWCRRAQRELRARIADRQRLRADFMAVFKACTAGQ